MLYPLIVFGGIFFWVLVALASVLVFVFEEKGASWLVAVGSLIIFYGLSTPPAITWGWVGAYFLIGALWFLVVFQYRLTKLKRFLNANPQYMKEDENGKKYVEISRYDNREMANIYLNEPSFDRFMNRTFCWPLSMLKIFLGDFVCDLYDRIAEGLKNYKANFLGLTK